MNTVHTSLQGRSHRQGCLTTETSPTVIAEPQFCSPDRRYVYMTSDATFGTRQKISGCAQLYEAVQDAFSITKKSVWYPPSSGVKMGTLSVAFSSRNVCDVATPLLKSCHAPHRTLGHLYLLVPDQPPLLPAASRIRETGRDSPRRPEAQERRPGQVGL